MEALEGTSIRALRRTPCPQEFTRQDFGTSARGHGVTTIDVNRDTLCIVMSEPARTLDDPNDTGPRPAARAIHWNGHDLPPELAALPPGHYQLVPLPPGLDYQPGDEVLTDATTDEVCDWLDGKAPCPWPR